MNETININPAMLVKIDGSNIKVFTAGPQGPTGATGATGATGQGVPAGGTAGQNLSKIDGEDFNTQWSDPAGGGALDYILIVDDKATGFGGSSVVGTQTRDLNTIVVDTAGHITGITSNKIPVPFGRWRYVISAPACRISQHSVELFNFTDSVVITNSQGGSEYAYNGQDVQSRAFGSGEFFIAAGKDMTLRHYTANARATYGLGLTGRGGVNICGRVELWRVGDS